MMESLKSTVLTAVLCKVRFTAGGGNSQDETELFISNAIGLYSGECDYKITAHEVGTSSNTIRDTRATS